MSVFFKRVVTLVLVLAVAGGLVAGAVGGIGKVRQAQADNKFVAGFHDPRTGEKAAKLEEFSGMINENVTAGFVVAFNPKCVHCQDHARELVAAWEELQSEEYTRGRVVILMVAIGGLTDKEVKQFAKEYNLPPEFIVVAGLEPEYGPKSVPYTDVIARHPDVPDPAYWIGVTSRAGTIPAAELVEMAAILIGTYDVYVEGLKIETGE